MSGQLLDNLDGYEFQELVADIFRKRGYKKVKVGPYSSDEGRDIIMIEAGQHGKILCVVECKHHKSSIGRPVVQKLHSAALTLSGTNQKKGFVVTSGFFSNATIEYAKKVNGQSNDIIIKLIDGRELKRIVIEVGVDFKSGTIQAISNVCLPFSSRELIEKSIIKDYFNNINGLETEI